jgi:hypothetical protein
MKEEEQVEALHKELRKEVASADCIAANSDTPPPLPSPITSLPSPFFSSLSTPSPNFFPNLLRSMLMDCSPDITAGYNKRPSPHFFPNLVRSMLMNCSP